MIYNKNTAGAWTTASGFDLTDLDPLHKVKVLEAATDRRTNKLGGLISLNQLAEFF